MSFRAEESRASISDASHGKALPLRAKNDIERGKTITE